MGTKNKKVEKKMKEIIVGIATHCKTTFSIPELSDCYKIIEVGAELHKSHFGELRDDYGDNISAKNPYYCELTAMYWLWKNNQSEIKGLCHYRRFMKRSLYHCLPCTFLTDSDIEQALNSCDIIIPTPCEKNVSVYDFYVKNSEKKRKELDILQDIIEEICPQYLNSYKEVFGGNKQSYWNIMIANREIFDEYCEWLFSILRVMEDKIDFSGYDEQEKRVFGYLAERLLNVWVKKKNLRIKYFPVHFINNYKKYKLYIFLDNLGVYSLGVRTKEMIRKWMSFFRMGL